MGFNTCSSTLEGNKKDLKASDQEDINALLSIIERINNNYPDSFRSKFIVEGHSGKQKFKASGNVQFNHDPRKMRIVFHDAVFKTPFVVLAQDKDIVKFYYPIDNKLFIDNINNLDIRFYSDYDLDININFIYEILTNKIPLIDNYSVKKGLHSDDKKPGASSLIILENDSCYETLSFSNKIPDKILWLNKKTKQKVEIYLNDPYQIKGVLSYENIRIISPDSDMKINIQFSSKKINIPFDLEKLTYIKLSKDVRIYNKN